MVSLNLFWIYLKKVVERCKRLNVPLLGKIPILEKIMLATDGGVPITAEELDSPTKDFYIKITENLLKQINSQGQ